TVQEQRWSRVMTPQIAGYVFSLESVLRPLVTAIALGLIWLGAARMPASREVTLHDCRCAIGGAHRLGSCRPVSPRGKYLINYREPSRGTDHIVRFADPARRRRHCTLAIGKHRKTGLRDPATLARGGSGLPRRRRHFPRALG